LIPCWYLKLLYNFFSFVSKNVLYSTCSFDGRSGLFYCILFVSKKLEKFGGYCLAANCYYCCGNTIFSNQKSRLFWSSAVGAGDATASASLSNFLEAKLIRFGYIWFDWAKFEQN